MDTQERILHIFREELRIDVPSPATDVLATGLLDSLALVTLLFEMERQLAVTIPLEELEIERLRTVEEMAALVDELRGEADHG